ncbi:hypothetical protein [Pelomonas sp. KK5]|uniref:hypothetical protein n=1 Tax=Pelomonas sp. KK5 TaxID=1855730 RepID=UPI00097BBBBA|nr:hypothetical protein [Pelomonas sp. KK5]
MDGTDQAAPQGAVANKVDPRAAGLPPTEGSSSGGVDVPAAIKQALYLVFLWCLAGIALGYGVRFWNDAPVHSSFIPFVGIAFSAILSFAVVMAFRSVSGEVDFQFGQVKFKGASGPVLFWSICFLAVAYGMYLLGITDVAKADAPVGYKSCSVGEIALHKCSLNAPQPDASASRRLPDPQAQELPQAPAPSHRPALAP